ncbi:MAG: CopD family protein [Steroidobacteraceae bacterium]
MPVTAGDVVAALLKTVLYATTFAGAGGVLFVLLCRQQLLPTEIRRLARFFGICFVLAVLVSGLRVMQLAAELSGDADGMLDQTYVGLVLQAGERSAVLQRLVGLVLAAFVFSRRSILRSVSGLGALLAATSIVWVSHAHASPRPAGPMLLEAVHLAGIAFWLGALVPLWLIAAQDARGHRIAAAAMRFGRAAVPAIGLLLLAGLAWLWQLLGSSQAAWHSDYARLMVLKLVFVAALLGLGALNKFRLTPRLARGDRGAARQLRRSIQFEILLAATILTVTATMTTLTGPPDGAIAGPTRGGLRTTWTAREPPPPDRPAPSARFDRG